MSLVMHGGHKYPPNSKMNKKAAYMWGMDSSEKIKSSLGSWGAQMLCATYSAHSSKQGGPEKRTEPVIF